METEVVLPCFHTPTIITPAARFEFDVMVDSARQGFNGVSPLWIYISNAVVWRMSGN